MNITLLLVDALNLIRRVYAAQPGNNDYEHVEGAIRATRQSLQRALRETGPTHALCVFDSKEKGWRYRMYADYKAGRDPMPVALGDGLAEFEEAFSKCGVSSLTVTCEEADDVIATLASKVAEHGGKTVILSTDKVFIQIINDFISLRDHFNDRDLDSKYVVKKFGVRPPQFIDFLALAGDQTNNIPGVPSVGPKTASRLLREIGPLDDILAVAHTIPGKVGTEIYGHKEDALLFRKLVSLRRDIAIGTNLKKFRYERQPDIS
ncbi:MAG: flap endonuclease Xni [Deltaproteobacteria bacterium]|nr:flap endonuclease Xni [Deltaproteobacteria bacterium]